MLAKLVSLALILVAGAAPVTAQLVRGHVADVESKLRLRAVDVALLDASGRAAAQATSDTTGGFELRAPRPGVYRLRAALLGYSPLTSDTIELRTRETVQVAVSMSAQAISVAPLVIVTRRQGSHLHEFEQRRTRQASGYYLTQKEIDRRPIASASTLLVGMPGVTLSTYGLHDKNEILMLTNQVTASGPVYCRAALWVDGRPVHAPHSIDDVLIASWVGAVEVYPRGSIAPLEYRTQSDCGVVLYWTRERENGARWSWKKIAVAAGFMAGAALLVR